MGIEEVELVPSKRLRFLLYSSSLYMDGAGENRDDGAVDARDGAHVEDDDGAAVGGDGVLPSWSDDGTGE